MVDELVALAERRPRRRRGRARRGDRRCSTPRTRPATILDDVVWRHRKTRVAPRTVGQKRYVDSIRTNTITFGIGPAGTGKTFLAVALAAAALSRKEVNRIILTRPAVEAGERLGFLPGDMMAKIDPYLRPLFDALHDMIDPERVSRHLERGVIEVAPLAFMRGRTLNDSFVILDEAQNTTPEQMKMFLTRLGFGSRMVVTGDVTQVDLPREQQSGPDRRRRHPRRRRGRRASSARRRGRRAPPARPAHRRGLRGARAARGAGDRQREARAHGVTLELDIVGAPRSSRARSSGSPRSRSPRRRRRRPPRGRVRRRGADPRAQPRAPRHGRADRRALVPDRRRRRPRRRPARARRRRDLPASTPTELREAVVHGVLHLCGMDHETDDGEMLALQRELLELDDPRRLRRARRPAERRQVDADQRDRRQPRSRSSPTARRRRGARSAASPPASTGSSCSSTCPACSARATR